MAFYFILKLIRYTTYRRVKSIAYPVGVIGNMLIRQIRSFGSFCKELVCMPRSQGAGKPKDFFKAPTYTIGGSNNPVHGRVG